MGSFMSQGPIFLRFQQNNANKKITMPAVHKIARRQKLQRSLKKESRARGRKNSGVRYAGVGASTRSSRASARSSFGIYRRTLSMLAARKLTRACATSLLA